MLTSSGDDSSEEDEDGEDDNSLVSVSLAGGCFSVSRPGVGTKRGGER